MAVPPRWGSRGSFNSPTVFQRKRRAAQRARASPEKSFPPLKQVGTLSTKLSFSGNGYPRFLFVYLLP